MKNSAFLLFWLFGMLVIVPTFAEKGADTTIFQEKQYKKIDVSEVSKDALSRIKKNYGDYTIKEAYRADDGEYKLVLVKDGGELTATFTSAGELIKIY